MLHTVKSLFDNLNRKPGLVVKMNTVLVLNVDDLGFLFCILHRMGNLGDSEAGGLLKCSQVPGAEC